MSLSPAVSAILENYDSENPGTRAKLVQMLNHGRLAGTGKMVILPVDQGFEHGPARSFAPNPVGYDPLYHWQLAIDAGLNAFAAPIGLLSAGAGRFAGQIPTILKVNSSNSHALNADQALTGSVEDALRLGCAAVGYTLYPGSDQQFDMQEKLRQLTKDARDAGLAVVVWSYPRGGGLSKDGETSLDVIAYAAHIAALMGAHVIKVKPPRTRIEQDAAKKHYEGHDWSRLEDRISHVIQSAFDGRRIVIFSGGEAKGNEAVAEEIAAIAKGGGSGSIIGRNAFQRSRNEALALLDQLIEIYQAQAAQEATSGTDNPPVARHAA